MGLKPILRTTVSYNALTLLVGSFDPLIPVLDTTYNVFSGTLNPAQSINPHCRGFPVVTGGATYRSITAIPITLEILFVYRTRGATIYVIYT